MSMGYGGWMVQTPKGIVQSPLTLTEGDFTLTASTASVMTEIARHAVPRDTSYAFKAGDPIYIYLATVAPAQITTGTIAIYLSDPNEITSIKIFEDDVTVFSSSRVDETLKARWPAGFTRDSDQLIIIKYNGSALSVTAQTKITIKGIQFAKT